MKETVMIRSSAKLLACLLLGGAATLLAVAQAAPSEKFSVCGGECSKSWRLIGVYDNAQDAFQAARTFQTGSKGRRVDIWTGPEGKVRYRDTPADSCSVYLILRCGAAELVGTFASPEEATLATGSECGRYEFVYHQTSVPPTPEPTRTYHIYTGSCSRSIRLVGSYETADQACWAAQSLRRGDPGARLGSPVRVCASPAPRWDITLREPQYWELHTNSCKSWRLRGMYATRLEALIAACEQLAEGNRVEMIGRYTAE
jgi:hypothetical protein